jgi:hypothetical protein
MSPCLWANSSLQLNHNELPKVAHSKQKISQSGHPVWRQLLAQAAFFTRTDRFQVKDFVSLKLSEGWPLLFSTTINITTIAIMALIILGPML